MVFWKFQGFDIPDNKYGEQVCAWVQLLEGFELDAGQVRDFFRVRIVHFKIHLYIKLVNSFPMTVTGKIQKFKNREVMANEVV